MQIIYTRPGNCRHEGRRVCRLEPAPCRSESLPLVTLLWCLNIVSSARLGVFRAVWRVIRHYSTPGLYPDLSDMSHGWRGFQGWPDEACGDRVCLGIYDHGSNIIPLWLHSSVVRCWKSPQPTSVSHTFIYLQWPATMTATHWFSFYILFKMDKILFHRSAASSAFAKPLLASLSLSFSQTHWQQTVCE